MAEAVEMSVSQIEGPKTSIGVHKNVRVHKDIQMILAEFTDKEGVKHTKLAVILAGQEVRFLSDDSLSGTVQPWLANPILQAAGLPIPKKG